MVEIEGIKVVTLHYFFSRSAPPHLSYVSPSPFSFSPLYLLPFFFYILLLYFCLHLLLLSQSGLNLVYLRALQI